MKARYGSIRFGAATMYRRISGRADTRRWSNLDNFDPEWGARADIIAGLIRPGSRVLEFGAGTRRLESALAPSCTYVPSDLVDRGPDTFVVNLNHRPLPSLAGLGADVVVLAGVLEYLGRLPEVVSWLAAETRTCIASYECAVSPPGSIRRLSELIRRSQSGWINAYTEVGLVGLFAAEGFACLQRCTWSTPDGDERIFVFEQPGPSVSDR